MSEPLSIAVVVPCYRVGDAVLEVLAAMPAEVAAIYVVDDACPDGSGARVEAACRDPRVKVLRNAENQGVGGAVMRGYRAALEGGADVVVKIDGDGQMDPRLVPVFIAPILAGDADYTKGNRFFNLESLAGMPPLRLFGNAMLSFLTKLSSGYWDVFDPTNGYTAIHAGVLRQLPLDKLARRYFFESDMLFRLNTLRAVVVDVPMQARYAGENSSLRISRVAGEFLVKHPRNFIKRIFYNYYLRDMSVASFELPLGLAMLGFGVVFGATKWIGSRASGTPTTSGTVMLAAITVIIGIQFVLAFLAHDISAVPKRAIHPRLMGARRAD